MPSTSPVVNGSPELPEPVSAETCHRTASRSPEWSPVHCMPQRCDPAQPSTIREVPRASELSSKPLNAASHPVSAMR